MRTVDVTFIGSAGQQLSGALDLPASFVSWELPGARLDTAIAPALMSGLWGRF